MLHLLYAQFFLIHTGPYVILAVVGIIVFLRDRTLCTALIALGFLAYVVGQLAGSFVSADVTKTYNSHGDVTAVVASFHGWAWTLSRYAGTVGMWVAAVAAAIHVFRSGRGRHVV